jgi:excisionase family DNA binding protein|tara:strand:+ start:273 stop:476 length:204 start_codon:yes stop_codon:yes gene_type:complete
MGESKVAEAVMGVTEMAKLLGLHPNKVRDLAHSRKLPGAFRLDKRIFFSRVRFEEFLKDPWIIEGGE